MEIFILGGGKSLSGFDNRILSNLEVIGCNKSAFVGRTKYLCSIDGTFLIREADKVRSFGKNAHIAPKDCAMFTQCTCYLKTNQGHMSEREGYITGKHSGHGAMNVAYFMGAKVIHLLGIDLNHAGHWHGGYGYHAQVVSRMKEWARLTDQAAGFFEQKGIRVINWSLGSELQAYEKRDITNLEAYLGNLQCI